MPSKRMSQVSSVYASSANEEIIVINLGDSRGSFRHWRWLGGVFRNFAVKHANLIAPAVGSANGNRDGLATLQITGLTGITNGQVGPGSTLPNSGLVNTLPCDLGEAWVTGVVSNPHFSRYVVMYSTAGGSMDLTGSDDSGGTFKLGDPSQGRNVVSISRFATTDNRISSSWLPSRTEWGYNGTETGKGPQVFSAPPSSSGADLLITEEEFVTNNDTGVQVTSRFRHTSGVAAIGQGHIWCATKIKFGNTGCTFFSVAYSGWSTTDHMANPTDSIANPDSKYTDAGIDEILTKVLKVSGKKVILRCEMGQNNPADPNFAEWNGTDSGNYKLNVSRICDRWVNRITAAGATSATVQLVCNWQSGTDLDRNLAQREDLSTLSDERGWAYYDQQQKLLDRGYSTNANGLDPAYTDFPDLVHQNFAGMNLLGVLEWEELAAGRPSFAPGSAQRANALRTSKLSRR